MHCPSCGTVHPTQARFCMGCGALLVSGMVCGNCHTVLPLYARYCHHCGAFLPQAGATAAPPIAVPQGAPPITVQSPPIPAAQPTPPAKADTHQVGQLPKARQLPELLPSLKWYLSLDLYEPLERRSKEQDLAAVRNHLIALLGTVKIYLPRPVIETPQPVGEPAGSMRRGAFLFGDVSGFTPLSEKLKTLEQAGAGGNIPQRARANHCHHWQ